MVLPGLAWVEVKPSTEKVDRGLEMFLVPIPTSPAFNRHDLAV